MDTAYVICRVEEIPNRQGRGFLLARLAPDGAQTPWPIMVVRWGQHVFAYENRCPHQGTRLDWEKDQFMDGTGERLICGKHGALFELDTGLCIEGPCAGRSLSSIRLSVEDAEICILGVELAETDEA